MNINYAKKQYHVYSMCSMRWKWQWCCQDLSVPFLLDILPHQTNLFCNLSQTHSKHKIKLTKKQFIKVISNVAEVNTYWVAQTRNGKDNSLRKIQVQVNTGKGEQGQELLKYDLDTITDMHEWEMRSLEKKGRLTDSS